MQLGSALLHFLETLLRWTGEAVQTAPCIGVLEKAGQTPEVGRFLADICGGITNAGVFNARDIATTEAAKVI